VDAVSTPIYYEPTDPPEVAPIFVDRELFESIVARHDLTTEVEIDGDRAVMTLDGLTFVAELSAVAS
jgi:hypothetical protein